MGAVALALLLLQGLAPTDQAGALLGGLVSNGDESTVASNREVASEHISQREQLGADAQHLIALGGDGCQLLQQ
jgi:hypothetical protein